MRRQTRLKDILPKFYTVLSSFVSLVEIPLEIDFLQSIRAFRQFLLVSLVPFQTVHYFFTNKFKLFNGLVHRQSLHCGISIRQKSLLPSPSRSVFLFSGISWGK